MCHCPSGCLASALLLLSVRPSQGGYFSISASKYARAVIASNSDERDRSISHTASSTEQRDGGEAGSTAGGTKSGCGGSESGVQDRRDMRRRERQERREMFERERAKATGLLGGTFAAVFLCCEVSCNLLSFALKASGEAGTQAT